MRFPWIYPWRSLWVRWPATLFSAFGIAMTVAVLCGVFAIREGFGKLLAASGSEAIVLYRRPGAQSEGESGIALDKVQRLTKGRPEIRLDEDGRPLAAGESYLALYLELLDQGGRKANVPLRGVEEMSFRVYGQPFRIVEGRRFTFGADEVVVGLPVSTQVADCRVGDTLVVNTTPFRIVGTFEHVGAYRSEIWGDVERVTAALGNPLRQRVVARLADGWTAERVAASLEGHRELALTVQSERAYFATQTRELSDVLRGLGVFLTVVLGLAAVLGAANTMLASVGARSREVGMLRAMGFKRGAILLSFLLEAGLIGLMGGLLGCVLVLPLDGIETGTLNWSTLTYVAFSFHVSVGLLGTAVLLAVTMGVLGGLLPAWRASRLRPITALRME